MPSALPALASALILAFPLLAAEPAPRVIPPHPDSHDAVRVITYPPCTAGSPSITRSDREIRIEFHHTPGHGCIATFSPYPVAVDIGVLEPGEWEIVVWQFEGPQTARLSLTVRGVDPFAIYPPGAPTTGARVRLGSEFFFRSDRTRVFFGDVEATVVPHSGEFLFVEAPPHAAGIVDVTAVVPEGKTFVARHAFKYYEPSGRPDPFVFEPLLFPSVYQGPGAAGSEWRSENAVAPRWPWRSSIVFHDPPCDGCSTVIETPVRLDLPNRPEGHLLWVGRGDRDDINVSSRLRDISRVNRTAGTEVPVVRVENFRQVMVLPNIPSAPGHRAMLRVWSLQEQSAGASLRPPTSSGVSEVVRTWQLLERMWFGSIDLTPLIAASPRDEILTLYVWSEEPESIWAMVTITNNETQQVTVVTPK